MSSNVYYKKINSETPVKTVQAITQELLQTIITKEKVKLEKKVPMKVHYGEHKNVTFVKSENYEGIINFLEERNIETAYIETSVLYGGKRYKKEVHEQTAIAHGFTQVPRIFADGDHGEDFSEVAINLKHFDTFKVGKAFSEYEQIIVLSHFKGHMLAGFGGAMKQLSMGFAAKGGKMAMHMGEKPRIISRKCIQCNLCKTRCSVDALHIGKRSWINKDKCVGCGACMAICPQKAITPFSLKSIAKALGIGNPFLEKLIEGAYAAAHNKRHIYINFGMNITPGCDCEARKMKTIMDDFGIFISTDPVAIDKACYNMVKERGKKFRGIKQFAYAEKIGLGSTDYTLHEIN